MTSAMTCDPIYDRTHPSTRGYTKLPIHGLA